MKSFVCLFLLIIFSGVNAGYGQPISKTECSKCKCTYEEPCTLEEIEFYRNNNIPLMPKLDAAVMCDMDEFGISFLFSD
jgi:hypothetical protein